MFYELLEEGMHALFGVLSNYLATVKWALKRDKTIH